MGELIYLHDRRPVWREVLRVEDESSRLYVYVNDATNEVEFVIINDEGEAVRTIVDRSVLTHLITTLGCRS